MTRVAIGTVGKYERLDVLGHGTSGVVYLAWDTLLRRQVALKEIRAAGPEMERILDEARVLDRLGRHPHIVQIHSVDRENGAILIDMELVRGENLSDLLRARDGKPLPVAEAIRIADAVLDALSYAHERRIIHRDIKPANILIGAEGGVVKLTDFGLAEALGSGSVAGGGGTYPYMAPEDFAEDAASDYQADLWAVGVVLYEMLTARRPFQVAARTKDPFAWKRIIQEEEPPPVSTVRAELPRSLDGVLYRALAKDKRSRFPDARAFASALKAQADLSPATVAAKPNVGTDAVTLKFGPALPAADDDSPLPAPFFFVGGAAAYTLDELLPLAARHWNESREALVDGRLERFLRAVGEVFIADLAMELRARGGDADRRLSEFLERSQCVVEAPDVDDLTIPAIAGAPAAPMDRNRIRDWNPRHFRPDRPAKDNTQRDRFSPSPALPPVAITQVAPYPSAPERRLHVPVEQAPRPAPTQPPAADANIGRWWFWPLFLLCLGPIGAEMSAAGHGAHGAESQFIMILRGWRASGLLTASLFIVGLGARFPTVARFLCLLPIAGGLVAAGALVSRVLGAQPSPDALVRAAVQLLLPVAALLIEAATVQRWWRFWSALTLAAAIFLTLLFLK